MDLSFTVENQTLKRTDKKEVVNLSENYLKLCFDFSSDWDTVDKYILIYHDGKVTRLSLSNDYLIVSSQFLTSTRLVFMVYGEIIEDDEVVYRITSNNMQVNLIDCNFTTNVDGGLDPEHDADIVEQLWSAINLKADSSDLSTVATSGSYDDLTDKPTLFSGSYTDLTDKPTIPVVVDTVADGNTNAVSSNAVYDYVASVIGNANNWLTQ